MKLQTALVAILMAIIIPQFTVSAVELSNAEFRRLHAELQPADDEAWRTIPWKISLLDAQHLAAKEQKLILIWAMDGHPLGCT